MMFEGFIYRQTKPQLADGIYHCKIVKAEPKKYNNGNWFCELTVEVDGHKDYVPNTIVINDRPVVGNLKANGNPITEDDCERWDRTHSRFLDAFGIDSRAGSTPRSWVGCSGNVKCAPQYDKNEADGKSKKYKELFPTLEQPGITAASAANLFQGSVVSETKKETKKETKDEGFPEDIPF